MKKALLLLLIPLTLVSCGSKKNDVERIRDCTNASYVNSHINECSSIYSRYAQACDSIQNLSQECREFNQYESQIAALLGSNAVVAGDSAGFYNDIEVYNASLNSIDFSVNGQRYYGSLKNGERLNASGSTNTSEYNGYTNNYNNTNNYYRPRVQCTSGHICKINMGGTEIRVEKRVRILKATAQCDSINNFTGPCAKYEGLNEGEGHALIVSTGDVVHFAKLGGGKFSRVNAVFAAERGGISRRSFGDNFTIINLNLFVDTLIQDVSMDYNFRNGVLDIEGTYDGDRAMNVRLELE